MRRWLSLSALATSLLIGCASKQEVIEVIGGKTRASEVEVNRDAFRLLPEGAVVWFRVEAPELFEADFGEDVQKFMVEALPFAEGAGISPKEDVRLVVGAMYATVGSDVVMICNGDFEKESTDSAIRKNPMSVLGKPIVSIDYSGAQMHVVDHVAMAVLTDETMVFGTQLGVRRVLERVEEGRLKRTIPGWYEALLTDDASNVQLGVDLDSQPVPATLGEKLEVMRGLRAARLLANFKKPGLNLAGTLTYDAPAVAESAALKFSSMKEELEKYELFMRAVGISQPIRRLKAQATGKDVQVVIGIEGEALSQVFSHGAEFAAGSEAGDWLPN